MTVYRPIIIKTKEDAQRFIDSFQGGPLYIEGKKEDICLERFKDEFQVSTRTKDARGNVFFPYIVLNESPAYSVYRFRKYINRQLMKEEL